LMEVAYIYECIKKKVREAQFVFATPQGGEAPIDPTTLKQHEHDEVVREFMKNSEVMRMLRETRKLDELSPEEFRVILFPGGPGAVVDLPNSQTLNKLVMKIHENNGIVGAIGHGIAGLVNVKTPSGQFWIKNKRLTCSTKDEDREQHLERDLPFVLEDIVKERGAKFDKGGKFEPFVIVDREERLITGQNPQSTKEWLLKLMEVACPNKGRTDF